MDDLDLAVIIIAVSMSALFMLVGIDGWLYWREHKRRQEKQERRRQWSDPL